MDPIANIKEQRELSAAVVNTYYSSEVADMDPQTLMDLIENSTRLAELVQALDDWQSAGGFSPYHPVPKYPNMAGE